MTRACTPSSYRRPRLPRPRRRRPLLQPRARAISRPGDRPSRRRPPRWRRTRRPPDFRASSARCAATRPPRRPERPPRRERPWRSVPMRQARRAPPSRCAPKPRANRTEVRAPRARSRPSRRCRPTGRSRSPKSPPSSTFRFLRHGRTISIPSPPRRRRPRQWRKPMGASRAMPATSSPSITRFRPLARKPSRSPLPWFLRPASAPASQMPVSRGRHRRVRGARRVRTREHGRRGCRGVFGRPLTGQVVRLDHPLPPARPVQFALALAPSANSADQGSTAPVASPGIPRRSPNRDDATALFDGSALVPVHRLPVAEVKVANAVVHTALPKVAQDVIARPSSTAGHFLTSKAPPVTNHFSGKAVEPLNALGFAATE